MYNAAQIWTSCSSLVWLSYFTSLNPNKTAYWWRKNSLLRPILLLKSGISIHLWILGSRSCIPTFVNAGFSISFRCLFIFIDTIGKWYTLSKKSAISMIFYLFHFTAFFFFSSSILLFSSSRNISAPSYSGNMNQCKKLLHIPLLYNAITISIGSCMSIPMILMSMT